MAEQEPPELSEQHFFYEDAVYRINKNGRVSIGIIMENYEAYSSDQESDSELYVLPPIGKGELRVSWHPTGREEVVEEQTVGLADRSLMPGDVVRRLIQGKDTQRGYCRDIQVQATVQVIGTHYVIPFISSERLQPLEEFTPDLAVCLDSWVGSTKQVSSNMTLEAADGSKLIWKDLDSCPFEDLSSKGMYEPSGAMFYPGQTVTSMLGALERAEWLTCTKEMTALRKHRGKEHKFVVQKIDTESVSVHWQCRALSHENEGGHEGVPTQPKPVVVGDELKQLRLLNLFEPCTLQVGDRNYLDVRPEDVILKIKEWRKQQSREYRALHQQDSLMKKKTQSIIKHDETDPKDSDAILKDSITHSSKPVIDNEEDWQTDSSASTDSNATHSSCRSSDSCKVAPKKPPVLVTKLLKGKKLKRTRRKMPESVPPKPGDKIVVEIVSTQSKANVVWQDGSIEYGIPSIQLFPIHHLDDQEFFPGDFVVAGAEGHEPPSMRDYGVVQSMDHQGRTALVKWFRTYTSTQEPKPDLLLETEVSVYDLKDHPDFQYRPATVVIRVANFVGEDATCTAGQVIDNFPEGRVKVWWVDGHASMCWPQDLFKVGEYDSDDGELWADNGSDDSWETQSVESLPQGSSPAVAPPPEQLKPRLAANVERARKAMARLEDIFTLNPALQSQEVMKKLLDVYKECRYLDRLMDTEFFHETHFQGLLERVRERGSVSTAQRVQDQMSRLFNREPVNELSKSYNSCIDEPLHCSSDEVLLTSTDLEQNFVIKTENFKFKDSKTSVDGKVSSKTMVCKDNNDTSWFKSANKNKNLKMLMKTNTSLVNGLQNQSKSSKNVFESLSNYDVNNVSNSEIPAGPQNSLNNVPVENTAVNMHETLESVSKKIKHEVEMINTESDILIHDDSKIQLKESDKFLMHSSMVTKPVTVLHSPCVLNADLDPTQTSDCSNTCYDACNDTFVAVSLANQVLYTVKHEMEERASKNILNAPKQSPHTETSPEHVCVRLCALIKAQLVAAHGEILRRYGVLAPSVADIIKESPDANSTEASVNAASPGVTVQGSTTDLPDQENPGDGFEIVDNAPSSHNYFLTILQSNDPPGFFKAVSKELKLLKGGLPPGVWVKSYEDRLDLISVLIRGPSNTPYEDGMFLFDFQLPQDYPRAPPLCHYISYCSDRLNPNLYEDGKVCVSLLGTWAGRGTEVWSPSSTLLQVLVSLQGLILVPEPYFNEAGYEKQKGSQSGRENSRMYNEMVVLKLVQATTKMLRAPPEVFRDTILSHFKERGASLIKRLENWMLLSEAHNLQHPTSPMTPQTFRDSAPMDTANLIPPDFPLIPASKGFCLSLKSALEAFKITLKAIPDNPTREATNMDT